MKLTMSIAMLIPFVLGSMQLVPANAAMAVANALEESPHVGVAYGKSSADATAGAIASCEKAGGGQACELYAIILKPPTGYRKAVCLAAAQGRNGDFGYAIGSTKSKARAAALASCKEGAIAPRQCALTGSTVCQDANGDLIK